MKRSPIFVASLVLVIVGALNWLLVGLSRFDLVAAIAGRRFGEVGPFNAVVYVLVGLAGIYLAIASMAASRDDQRRGPTRFVPH